MIDVPTNDDGKNWARLIVNRMQAGRKYCSYSRRIAHEVLGLPMPDPVKRNCTAITGSTQRVDTAHRYEYDREFA